MDFLSRELQALEIDQRVKRDLETQVGSLEEKLARSEQLNQQYLRRIQMLEQELQQALIQFDVIITTSNKCNVVAPTLKFFI